MSKKIMKKNPYYIFWGSATILTFVGLIYVGTGFRIIAKAINNVAETVIIESERLDLQGGGGFVY